MFAHAIGFGLLERPVVRWLSDEEWEACGYTIEKEGDYYSFSREPLKRFENIAEDITSLKLSVALDDKYLDKVLSAIQDIREKILLSNQVILESYSLKTIIQTMNLLNN